MSISYPGIQPIHDHQTAQSNYKNACEEIKSKYDLNVGDIFPSYGTSEQSCKSSQKPLVVSGFS